MGVKVIRNSAEDSEAAIVLTNTGQFRVASRAKMPALAAVSPKRETGAWILESGFAHVRVNDRGHLTAQSSLTKLGPTPRRTFEFHLHAKASSESP